MITVTAKLTLYSPISSKDGIYGSLQNGTFLSDHPPKATLVDNARDTVQLGVLAQLFRVMVIPSSSRKSWLSPDVTLEIDSYFVSLSFFSECDFCHRCS